MSISPDLLNDALEGRTVLGASHTEAAGLVRLATAVRRLEPPGPGPAARARMRADFEQVMAGRRRRPLGIVLPWLGAGGQPRPLIQRLAAGAMLLAAAGSAGTAAAGSNPVNATVAVVRFAGNLAVNLDPNRENHLTTPTPTQNPSGERGVGVAATSAPQEESDNNSTGPTATPSATPTPPVNLGAPGIVGDAATDPGTQGGNEDSPPTGQPAGDDSRATPAAAPTQDGASATPSPSPTPTATKTPTPGATPNPGATSGPPVLAPTPGDPGSASPTPSATPSPSSTPHDDHEDGTPTASPTRTRTATATPTSTDHEDDH